jgi:hypothetical protein
MASFRPPTHTEEFESTAASASYTPVRWVQVFSSGGVGPVALVQGPLPPVTSFAGVLNTHEAGATPSWKPL